MKGITNILLLLIFYAISEILTERYWKLKIDKRIILK